MSATYDRQSEKVDMLQVELATVEDEIAHLQVKRVPLSEFIAAAKHQAEEM